MCIRDSAMAVYADGVHVGQTDLPAYAIKEIFDGYIGVSTHTVDEAREAEKYADYLGVGPIFATKTKEDAREAIGIDGLKKIVNAVKKPVIAIGGITADHVSSIFKAGASGIAVVSAIAAEKDVEAAARRFVELAHKYKFS